MTTKHPADETWRQRYDAAAATIAALKEQLRTTEAERNRLDADLLEARIGLQVEASASQQRGELLTAARAEIADCERDLAAAREQLLSLTTEAAELRQRLNEARE